MKVKTSNKLHILLFASWLIASVSTLGSLFLSDVMGLIPCTLCWYQRILMYPLVVIFLVGLISHSRDIVKFSMPFSLLGMLCAGFHVLIERGVIPESVSPCQESVPCSLIYFELLGFITIPLMSLFSFTLIFALLNLIKRTLNEQK